MDSTWTRFRDASHHHRRAPFRPITSSHSCLVYLNFCDTLPSTQSTPGRFLYLSLSFFKRHWYVQLSSFQLRMFLSSLKFQPKPMALPPSPPCTRRVMGDMARSGLSGGQSSALGDSGSDLGRGQNPETHRADPKLGQGHHSVGHAVPGRGWLA